MKQLFIENFVVGLMSCLLGYVLNYVSYTDYKLPEESIGIYILFVVCMIFICLLYEKRNKVKRYNLKLLYAASYGVLRTLYFLFPLSLLLISYIKNKTGKYLILDYSAICYFIGLTLILRFMIYIYLQKKSDYK